MQVCGRDWKEHSSSTGGYYSCNRFVPDGAVDTEPSGIRAFLSSLYGRVQVPSNSPVLACQTLL